MAVLLKEKDELIWREREEQKIDGQSIKRREQLNQIKRKKKENGGKI